MLSHKPIIKKLAISWTVFILLLCFLPSNEVPDLHIPLMDKWAHFIMFGVFAFLWLATLSALKSIHFVIVFLLAVIYGWLVEVLQGQLSFLGRSKDNMDILADALGGLIGTVVFYLIHTFTSSKEQTTNL